MENPYSWSDSRLLDEFMNACARAGVSGSGLVISLSGNSDLGKAHYLRNVLSARLNRAEPPAKPGDKVRPKSCTIAPSHYRGGRPPLRKLPDTLTIEKIYYRGDRWEYVFEERSEATANQDGVYGEDGGDWWWIPLNFNAEDFELKEVVPAKV